MTIIDLYIIIYFGTMLCVFGLRDIMKAPRYINGVPFYFVKCS